MNIMPTSSPQDSFFPVTTNKKDNCGQGYNYQFHSGLEDSEGEKRVYFLSENERIPHTKYFGDQSLVFGPLNIKYYEKMVANSSSYFAIAVTVKKESDQTLVRINHIYLSKFASALAFNEVNKHDHGRICEEIKEIVKNELTEFLTT